MHFSSQLLNEAALAACWTLVHSLWQGLLLVILTGLVIVLTRRSRPVVRYRLLSALVVLFAATSVVTFAREWGARVGEVGVAAAGSGLVSAGHAAPGVVAAGHGGSGLAASGQGGTGLVSAGQGRTGHAPVIGSVPGMVERVSGFLSEHAVLIVLIWLLVLGVRLGRMSWALAYMQHIRRRESRSLPEYWTGRVKEMSERLGLRRPVLLLESAVMKIPAVFGHLKPVIFLPIGLFAQLPPEQAEAILLHELAHIKRDDYLMNLLQSIVEHLFFFNPAVRWLSALVREERENCCDEMAIAGTGNKTQLVRALIGFRELSLGSGTLYGMGFAGRRNVFVNRITRIVQNRSKGLTAGEGVFFGFSVLLIGFLAMAFKQDGPREAGDRPTIAVASGLAAPQGPVLAAQIPGVFPVPQAGEAALTPPPPPMNLDKDTLPGRAIEGSERDRLVSLDVDLAHGKQVVVAWYEGRLYHITQVNGVVTQLRIEDKPVPTDKLEAYSNTVRRIFEKLDRVRVENDDPTVLTGAAGIAERDRLQELMKAEENQELARGDLAKRLKELQNSRDLADSGLAKRLTELSVFQDAADNELAKRLAEMSFTRDAASRELAKRLAEMQAANLDSTMLNADLRALERTLKEQQLDFERRQEDFKQQQSDLERQLRNEQRANAEFRAKLNAKALAILDEIVSKGIVDPTTQIHSFLLTEDGFFINGKRQSDPVYEAFVKKFVPDPDKHKQFRFEYSNK